MQDMTGIDLAKHPSSRTARKRPVTVQVEFATRPGRLATLEGSVAYRTGDALLTGQLGERWPIRRDKFLKTYEAVEPGPAGAFRKRPLDVHVLLMSHPFAVATGPEQDTITGQPGDWLVQYAQDDYGIVAAAIFAESYELLQ